MLCTCTICAIFFPFFWLVIFLLFLVLFNFRCNFNITVSCLIELIKLASIVFFLFSTTRLTCNYLQSCNCTFGAVFEVWLLWLLLMLFLFLSLLFCFFVSLPHQIRSCNIFSLFFFFNFQFLYTKDPKFFQSYRMYWMISLYTHFIIW